jgi:hypothetical protein
MKREMEGEVRVTAGYPSVERHLAPWTFAPCHWSLEFLLGSLLPTDLANQKYRRLLRFNMLPTNSTRQPYFNIRKQILLLLSLSDPIGLNFL